MMKIRASVTPLILDLTLCTAAAEDPGEPPDDANPSLVPGLIQRVEYLEAQLA